MRKTIRDWLTVLASLSDDAAIVLLILVALQLLGVPISLPVIVCMVLVFIASALAFHKWAMPVLHMKKKVGGEEGMLGLEGRVVEAVMPNGLIIVRDEYWEARSSGEEIGVGETVEVVGIDGLLLKVRRRRRRVR